MLIWPDIFGLRPAFRQMAKRLAESGYAVLVINPFYRTKKAPTAPEHPDFNDPPTRDALMGLMGSLTPDTALTDAEAFVAWLDASLRSTTGRKIGTTGYCMGGPFTMRTAAAFPDAIGAGASFHGGGLVTDKPDSPHLLIPKMKAHYLIAIAANDDEKQPRPRRAARCVRRGEAARGDRGLRGHACTAGARPTHRSTTTTRPRRPGAACWCSSATRSPSRHEDRGAQLPPRFCLRLLQRDMHSVRRQIESQPLGLRVQLNHDAILVLEIGDRPAGDDRGAGGDRRIVAAQIRGLG